MIEREGVSEDPIAAPGVARAGDPQRFESPPVGDDGIARALAEGRPAMICETPDVFGTRRAGRPLEVTGWAHSGAGIAAVLVTIDHDIQVKALHGLIRPDLRKLYGGELGSAGFAARLDPDEWTSGWHELTVVAITGDGRAIGISGQVECVEDEGPPRTSPDGVIDPLPDDGHWLGSDDHFVPELHRELSIAPEHHARYRWAATLAAGKTVLDVGCGSGWGTALLAESAREATGVEVSPPAVAEAKRRYGRMASFRQCELSPADVELADLEFDVVVCFETLERVAEPSLALDELARVLRPGGLLAVSCANRGVYPSGNPLHQSELTSDELEAALRDRFANVAIHRQQTYTATLLGDDAALAADDPAVTLDLATTKLIGGPPGSELYAVALATDGELPPPRGRVVLGTAVDHDEQRRLTRQWHQRSVYAEIEGAVIRTDAHYAHHAQLAAHARAIAREEELKQRLAQVERERDSARAAGAVLQHSASWRLTAPLRAVKRFAGGSRLGSNQ